MSRFDIARSENPKPGNAQGFSRSAAIVARSRAELTAVTWITPELSRNAIPVDAPPGRCAGSHRVRLSARSGDGFMRAPEGNLSEGAPPSNATRSDKSRHPLQNRERFIEQKWLQPTPQTQLSRAWPSTSHYSVRHIDKGKEH